MNQQQLIDLATKHGLIFLTEEHPKTNPNHQRLLSKLEKFAMSVAWYERNKEFLNSEES